MPENLREAWRATFELYDANDRESAEIRAVHLRQVLRLTPVMMLANVICAILVVASLGPLRDFVTWLWGASILGLCAWAMNGWRHVRASQPPRVSVRAFRRATIHAAALASCWAIAAALWFAEAQPALQVLIASLVTGMLGAGAFTLAMLPRASLIYVAIVTAGLLFGLWRAGEPVYAVAAVLLSCYASVVAFGSMAAARQSTALLRSRYLLGRQGQVVSLLLRDFEESASDALWEVAGNGTLTHVSPRMAELLGARVDDLQGRHLLHCLADRLDDASKVQDALAAGAAFRDVKVRLGHGGSMRWLAFSGKPKDPAEDDGGGWRGVIADVTEAQRSEDRLRSMAEQDPLTGLANRRALLAAAQAALVEGRASCLLSIDLDHFKAINDTSGHSTGDEVLRVIAARLRRALRPGDLVARLGGDEFAVLLGGADGLQTQDRAVRLLDTLGAPLQVGPRHLHVGASIGIACLDATVSSVEDLMINADLALYEAKRAGRGRHATYTPRLRENSRRAHEVEQALRGAVGKGQFALHFQPKVDTTSLRTIGVEALARWRHPVLGAVPPAEFVPAAERCGLIHEIGGWVLQQACRAAVRLPGLAVAVNVSAMQLMDREFVGRVREALLVGEVDPARLTLEITESLLLDGSQGAIDQLHRLSALGVQVALDDFGTGYSALAYLRSFPFDTLKIDRAFISALPTSADATAIVDMIVRLAGQLGMNTVAEGVETAQEFEGVRACGCRQVQGHLISAALPLPDLQAWLARGPVPALLARPA